MYQKFNQNSPWMLFILHSGACNEDIVWHVLSKQAPDDVMVANGTQIGTTNADGTWIGATSAATILQKPWQHEVLLGILLSCYTLLTWLKLE